MARKNENKNTQGFLSRLRRDEAGNVLMIMGASLIPMLAIIGGTVDISRGYMVKVRLQQACDAGALGGRQAVGEGTFGPIAQARAQALFDANYPANYQGSSGTVFTPSSTDSGITIKGTATTTMPTVIMGLFKDEPELKGLKTQSIKLTTECNAKLDVNNSDVSMVLDTTGSMKCPNDNNDAQCTTYLNSFSGSSIPEASNSRIAALKTATSNFVNILNGAAASSTARIRYSIVPFAQTVNTGKLLYALNPNYIVGGNANENWNYQSRRAVYTADIGPVVTTTYDESASINGYTAYLQTGECSKFSNNVAASVAYYKNRWNYVTWQPSVFGYSNGKPATNSGDPNASFNFVFKDRGGLGNAGNDYLSCTRTVTRTGPTRGISYDPNAPGAVFKEYEYLQRALPVSAYVASGLTGGSAVPDLFNIPSDSGGTQSWAGCILERDTVATSNLTFNASTKKMTTPNMWDLDIDAAPTNDVATRWRPYWPESGYYRYSGVSNNKLVYTDATVSKGGEAYAGCPYEAKALQKFTNAEFNAYIANLTPGSGTYHDIGALWGLRLASPEGIFAANVNEAPPNNGYVSRHMIIMTDGAPGAQNYLTDAYGVEVHDKKITGDGSNTNLDNLHVARFKAICEAAKAKKIRVWFVAFGTTLSADMIACASPDSTYSATNSAQLNSAFVDIAQSVSELRLTK